ncbi:probable aspartyl protease At4g16563, partial [Typha latifolia]|uniref:probable aspartyl protease At4g16563 n=1 Tax=Typha latifolia TaxID=4733 RepID=UPI003C2C0A8B
YPPISSISIASFSSHFSNHDFNSLLLPLLLINTSLHFHFHFHFHHHFPPAPPPFTPRRRRRQLPPPPRRCFFPPPGGAPEAPQEKALQLLGLPLYPHSYGGYSLTLSFGSPPQTLPLLLDTGSHISWLPCTHSYSCRQCSTNNTPITPTFLPKSSSSSRLIGCSNPSCLWIHPRNFLSDCLSCTNSSSSSDCARVCPPYAIIYGSGSTAGILLSDSLILPSRSVPGFVFGCSVFSDSQPAGGIAGFGRGAPSLPAQLGLRRFSYCLISRRFDDDAAVSGSLVLGGRKQSAAADGLRFAPFLPNPSVSDPFSVYYYVALRRITVGGKKVRLPEEIFVPGPSGNGGAIVDSGTTFTYIEAAAFELLVAAFVNRVAGRFNRSSEAEDRTGLPLCFNLPPGKAAAKTELPELAFHFKGGAEMRLPVENSFVLAGPSPAAAPPPEAPVAEAVCLAILSDSGGAGGGGPAVIIGSFQQQNYYMVYDLERERLGFRRQSCLAS